jgi:hypothetical protein
VERVQARAAPVQRKTVPPPTPGALSPAPTSQKYRPPRSWVYAIAPVGGGLTKIGCTVDVPLRLATLQTGSPVPLVVLWRTEGDAVLEAQLHAAFAAKRRQGEWFDLGPDPIAAIKAVLG